MLIRIQLDLKDAEKAYRILSALGGDKIVSDTYNIRTELNRAIGSVHKVKTSVTERLFTPNRKIKNKK